MDVDDQQDTFTKQAEELALGQHTSSMPLNDTSGDDGPETPKAVSPPRRHRRPTRPRGKSRRTKSSPNAAVEEQTAQTKQTQPTLQTAETPGLDALPPVKSAKRNRHRPRRRNPNAKTSNKPTAPQEPTAVDDAIVVEAGVEVAPASVAAPVTSQAQETDKPGAKPVASQPSKAAVGAKVDRADIRVVEASGIPGRGRVNTLLCAECAQKINVQKPLRSKALRLKAGQAAIFAGLAAVAVRHVAPPEKTGFLLLFTTSTVSVQRVRESVVDQFLQNGAGAWSFEACNDCVERLRKGGWEEVEITLDTTQDLAIHGLGWISARQSAVTLRVVLPAGILVSLRPRLVGPKEHAE